LFTVVGLVRFRPAPTRNAYRRLSQCVLTVTVLCGLMRPPLHGIDEVVVGRYEQFNGCTVKGAGNFSWSGMSSAVRRLTQGAMAPNPRVPVIECTSGHHDHFTCFLCQFRRFRDSALPSGALDPDDGYLVDFLVPTTASLATEVRTLDSSVSMKDRQ